MNGFPADNVGATRVKVNLDPSAEARADGDSLIYHAAKFRTKLHTLWLKSTYPFATFGEKVSIDPSCAIRKSMAREVAIGDQVYLGREVWLNVASGSHRRGPKIVLGNGCEIGRRSTISARNRIVLEADVLLAPSVLLMDHNHEFSNIEMPIHAQGITDGGTIIIERNCWLGHGAVIVCNQGELTIGRNSVVGANSVVTKSFPAYSVIAGSPARLIRNYDPQTGKWVRAEAGCKRS